MNYFEYFSEVEERFVARRGSLLMLSTLDWALIETWRDAGVPLAAVLRGIDAAFDRYEARKSRSRGRLAKVNGLSWCAQAVMEEAAALAEASVGGRAEEAAAPERATGFELDRIVRFIRCNAQRCEEEAGREAVREKTGFADALRGTAERLRALAAEVLGGRLALESLDQQLSVVEERLKAALLTAVPEAELLAAREAADRELAAYRKKLGAVQLRQVREQMVQKRLMESYRLPRLSLFYLPMEEDAAAAWEAE